MEVDTFGDVSLTLLGIAASMTLWTACVTMRGRVLASFTCGLAALGWAILSGRWLYAATFSHDWISAPWPSQLGLILLALASILGGWHAVFVALRIEHERQTRRPGTKAFR